MCCLQLYWIWLDMWQKKVYIYFARRRVCSEVIHSCNATLWLLLLFFNRSGVSDSLWLRGLQHARLPCLSPSPRACWNSCPLSWWCRPTISSSGIPFSSCPLSLSASGSFPESQLFTSGGQSIEASASASLLPMNIQDWFPLGWMGWISLQTKGLKSLL